MGQLSLYSRDMRNRSLNGRNGPDFWALVRLIWAHGCHYEKGTGHSVPFHKGKCDAVAEMMHSQCALRTLYRIFQRSQFKPSGFTQLAQIPAATANANFYCWLNFRPLDAPPHRGFWR